MSDTRPNIIFINTDQQRYDTIGALGYPWMKTPNLDRLVREGTVFTQCHTTAPSCVPARASFFNLQYPHDLGVYDNSFPWGRSWIEDMRDSGYFTVNVGKMHTVPMDAQCGFDKRFVVENKDRPVFPGYFYDEWDKFLRNAGVRRPSRWTYKDEAPDYYEALGAFQWPLDEMYHPDVFVGNMAKWVIRENEVDKPLFLEIGFPGPHPPYDPPKRYLDMYEDVDIPVPDVTDEELAGQPPPHKGYRDEMVRANHDAVRWTEKPTKEQLLKLRRHYAANMTLLDDQIGEILDVLEEKGYLENAVVVFTSDHGDCMGDHGHIQKWTMYDEITRMPTIAWGPGLVPQGKTCDELLQLFDVGEMLVDFAGLEIPEKSRSINALSVAKGEIPGRDTVYAEHSVTVHLKELEFVTMVRTKDWKMVHYVDEDFGELYDLNADPGELKNLWDDSECDGKRRELIENLCNWRIRLPRRQAKRLHDKAVAWREKGTSSGTL